MIYAGIGSRETPPDILNLMELIGFMMCYEGWTLRSGYAQGADRAFYQGYCQAPGPGKVEIYIPWEGFNGARSDSQNFFCLNHPRAMEIAQAFHPAWDRCSPGARTMHARNGYQILGSDLQTPADLVICWTPGAKGGGGTGQALRIARAADILIIDLADPAMEAKAREQVRVFFQSMGDDGGSTA
jgi:hypothetical protein